MKSVFEGAEKEFKKKKYTHVKTLIDSCCSYNREEISLELTTLAGGAYFKLYTTLCGDDLYFRGRKGNKK